MAQERKDVEKYLKHLASRFYQVIVQSRSGRRQKTVCVPPSKSRSATYWYWLDVPNTPPTSGDGGVDVPPPVVGRPLCVEVAVETSEGDIVLETWVLSLERPVDDRDRTFSVYTGLSSLLRSVIITSRIMTGYHVARQYHGDITLKHRFYNGKPKLEGLGRGSNDYNVRKIGSVPTMLGQVTIATAWRKDDSIRLPSAIASMSMTSNYFGTSEANALPGDRETVPAQVRRTTGTHPLQTAMQITVPTLAQPPVNIQQFSEDETDGGFESFAAEDLTPLVTAFGVTRTIQFKDPEPFAALLERHDDTPTGLDQDEDEDTPSETNQKDLGVSLEGSSSSTSSSSEFVHVDVKTVFDTSDPEDIGQVYRRLLQLPRSLPLLDHWERTMTKSELEAEIANYQKWGEKYAEFSASLQSS